MLTFSKDELVTVYRFLCVVLHECGDDERLLKDCLDLLHLITKSVQY